MGVNLTNPLGLSLVVPVGCPVAGQRSRTPVRAAIWVTVPPPTHLPALLGEAGHEAGQLGRALDQQELAGHLDRSGRELVAADLLAVG